MTRAGALATARRAPAALVLMTAVNVAAVVNVSAAHVRMLMITARPQIAKNARTVTVKLYVKRARIAVMVHVVMLLVVMMKIVNIV
jgi:hypothetical protein